jgi:hypothetical protein
MLEEYFLDQNFSIKQDRLKASIQFISASTILVQPPLASVPLPAKRHQRCNYCLAKAQLQCCSRCRSAYFCSNECFRNAWLHFHRVLCEPQSTDIYKDVDADRWLLERTALTLHSHNRLNKQHSHSHLPIAIHALKSHSSTLCTDAESDKISPVERVHAFLEPFDCQIPLDELSVLWKRLQISTFPILDPEHHLKQVAVGVFPLTSLYVQHSCRPNAAAVYKQGVQHLIALEDIAPGETITISYVDLALTKEQRWKELKARFGNDFHCDCIRCDGELSGIDEVLAKGETLGLSKQDGIGLMSNAIVTWNILEMAKKAEQRESDSWTPLQVLEPPEFTHFVIRLIAPDIYYPIMDYKKRYKYKLSLKENRVAVLKRLPDALSALLNVPQVPAFSRACISAAEDLLLERIAQNKWVEASRLALYLFVVYRIIYPPLHPRLSYHILILARSSWNALVELELIGVNKKLERIYANGVTNWIEIGKDAIEATFGKGTSLWRDIIELQWVYNREQKVKGSS